MKTTKIYLKDLIWTHDHSPIPAGKKVSVKNGNRLDLRSENLLLVPESDYPGNEGHLCTTNRIAGGSRKRAGGAHRPAGVTSQSVHGALQRGASRRQGLR